MTQLKKMLAFGSLLIVAMIIFNACKKNEDQMIPPKLDFKVGSGFTSADATVSLNTAVLIGVIAQQTEVGDYLKTFTVSHAFDGGAEVTDSTVVLDESQHEMFETIFHIITRNQTGTEKYIFTISNRDGLITSKSLTLTVQ